MSPTPRSKHRTGRPFRRARRAMFATQGTVCWICGHEGATDADHVRPVSLDPDQPVDADSMRPAHGVRGCDYCGRKCNRERSNKVDFQPLHTSEDW